jgi:hypothetical protein
VLDLAWMASRPLSTLLVAGSGFPSTGIPHLDRLMPRYASAEVVGGLAFALPVAWTFERVEGAVLRGRAAPGARVVVEIPFRERGRPHTWRGWGDASADGSYALRVPVPTGRAWPTLVTGAAALLRVPGRPDVTLAIPEAAVRSGETLEVR